MIDQSKTVKVNIMKMTGTSIWGAFFIGLVLLLASAGAHAAPGATIENKAELCADGDMYDWLREGNCTSEGGRHDDGRQTGGHVYESGHMGGDNAGGTDGGSNGGDNGGNNGGDDPGGDDPGGDDPGGNEGGIGQGNASQQGNDSSGGNPNAAASAGAGVTGANNSGGNGGGNGNGGNGNAP